VNNYHKIYIDYAISRGKYLLDRRAKEKNYIPVKAEEKVKVFPKICYKYMH
jgi:hypothetical protein